MSDPLLHVTDLHVSFETHDGLAQVINGVDLTIGRGETAAVVGETGCGKSVTVKTILGLIGTENAQVSGRIEFDGRNLLDLSAQDRSEVRGQEMGLIMQDPMTSLNPVLTVGEQMLDVLKWRGERRVGISRWLRSKFQDDDNYRERAITMLEKVEISAPERVFESYPVELSGGMRQRVLIAIALLTEPKLLIADEPTTALDVTTESKILDLLAELIDEIGTTVLYITHNLGVARKISDKINVMYAGEIVESAPTEALFEHPQHPYTRGLLDSIPKLTRDMSSGIGGQIPDYTSPPSECRFVDRCPHAERACNEQYPYPRVTEDNHTVACHLYDGSPTHDRFTPVEEVNLGTQPRESQEVNR
ncbi:ATP-binding cassette domain-containing protein [Natrialba sp. INN-245]|nr:ATP-binding cassette domain-containing protein [Natrialba sp. INN-245]